VFTRSAITLPNVNRFGWILAHFDEHIVGGWPWQILGAVRAVETVWGAAEILFFFYGRQITHDFTDFLSDKFYIWTQQRRSVKRCKRLEENIVKILPRDAMLARYMLSSCVRPSVGPSVTSRSSTKTVKPRITQTTPYHSPVTVVYWRQRCRRN